MCQYQTLSHHDTTGYVIRCTDCEKIQVAYSNLVMTFSPEDYDAFCNWIKKIKDEQPERQNTTVRCIMIPAPCHGIQFIVKRCGTGGVCIIAGISRYGSAIPATDQSI